MDRTDEYARILKRVVKKYETITMGHGQIRTWSICDDEQRHYAIICAGWHEPRSPMQGRRTHNAVFFGRVDHGVVYLEHDGIGDGITNDLLEAGVAQDDIVHVWMNRPVEEPVA